MERVLYRLSVSEYADSFILKGGILLYAYFGSDFPRVTRDIDFLAQHISNETQFIKEVFQKIFSIEEDDALKFDINNTIATNITEFKEYHGVNISTVAYLDKTRIPIFIDIGFGDVVFPEKVKMDYPVLLNMDSPTIYTYSKESVIAEKYEAIVQLGYGNGRLKDFYDIQLMATNFDFDGTILKEAIIETFNHRNTLVDDSYLYDDAFIKDTLLASRWEIFKKRKQAFNTLSFADTIIFIRNFLSPVIMAIINNQDFSEKWDHNVLKWIKR